LKLLAEGEEALPDDDEVEVVTEPVEGDDVDPVVDPVVRALDVAVVTEPDKDDVDDADVDPELVEVTVAPMLNGELVSIGALILSIGTASSV